MASHRKPATRARRSETAALASARLAPHRASISALAAPMALATLDRPRPEPVAEARMFLDEAALVSANDDPLSRSGWGSVSKGQSAATVQVPGMTPESLVLVTLQSVLAKVYVHGAVPAKGEFTVHLSKRAPRDTRFAWHVLD
jgi:hypothetical protein